MEAHNAQNAQNAQSGGQAAQGQLTTMKTVYTVVERGQGKNFWCKVGVGFINRDGSINLKLDAIPVNGTLQVRDYEAPGDRSWERERSGSPTARRDRELGPDPLSPYAQLTPPLT